MISRTTRESSDARAALLQVFYKRHTVLEVAVRRCREKALQPEETHVYRRRPIEPTIRKVSKRSPKDASKARKRKEGNVLEKREKVGRTDIPQLAPPTLGPSEPFDEDVLYRQDPSDLLEFDVEDHFWSAEPPKTPTRPSIHCQTDFSSLFPLSPPPTPSLTPSREIDSNVSSPAVDGPFPHYAFLSEPAGFPETKWTPPKDIFMDATVEELFNAYIHTDACSMDNELISS